MLRKTLRCIKGHKGLCDVEPAESCTKVCMTSSDHAQKGERERERAREREREREREKEGRERERRKEEREREGRKRERASERAREGGGSK